MDECNPHKWKNRNNNNNKFEFQLIDQVRIWELTSWTSHSFEAQKQGCKFRAMAKTFATSDYQGPTN
jgi:hypothetical protein